METHVDGGIEVLRAGVLDEVFGSFDGCQRSTAGDDALLKLGEEMGCPAIGGVYDSTSLDAAAVGLDGHKTVDVLLGDGLHWGVSL